MKNKALAKNIKISQLLDILKQLKSGGYVDIEIQEFEDQPNKIIIRPALIKDEESKDIIPSNHSTENSSKTDNVDNPDIDPDISYKDLLGNLN